MANETVVLTKNQLVKILHELAKAHYQIKGFGYGNLDNISTCVETAYNLDNDSFGKSSSPDKCPIMWVTPIRYNLVGKELFYNFDILIADLVKKDGDIEVQGLEVESDSALICLDLCSMLDNQFKDRFYNTRNTTIDPFEERFNDDYTGSIMTVSLKSPFNYNRCQVPAIPINPEPVNPCLPATIRDSAGNLLYEVPSGNTQLIGDSAYTIKDQNGNILDTGFILAQGSKEITLELQMTALINKTNIDTTFQDDLLIGIPLARLAVFASGTEQKTIYNLLPSGWDESNGRGTFEAGLGGIDIIIIVIS